MENSIDFSYLGDSSIIEPLTYKNTIQTIIDGMLEHGRNNHNERPSGVIMSISFHNSYQREKIRSERNYIRNWDSEFPEEIEGVRIYVSESIYMNESPFFFIKK